MKARTSVVMMVAKSVEVSVHIGGVQLQEALLVLLSAVIVHWQHKAQRARAEEETQARRERIEEEGRVELEKGRFNKAAVKEHFVQTLKEKTGVPDGDPKVLLPPNGKTGVLHLPHPPLDLPTYPRIGWGQLSLV